MRVQRPKREKGLEDEEAAHTGEVVRKLREADAVLSAGGSITDACRKLGISEATYHRWRRKYEGMEVQALKKLKALEQENAG